MSKSDISVSTEAAGETAIVKSGWVGSQLTKLKKIIGFHCEQTSS
jgi:hypothetical protein